LFSDIHVSNAHGKTLLKLWMLSLPTNPTCKPPLVATGDPGSGKTRTIRGMAELYGLPFMSTTPKVATNRRMTFGYRWMRAGCSPWTMPTPKSTGWRMP
jgi:hypothetical protein